MQNLHSIGNQLEAVVWFLVALVCLVKAVRSSSSRGALWPGVIASLAFLMFGISDLVEIRTGVWWRPWWLLLWKSLCVATFVGLWWKTRRASSARLADPSSFMQDSASEASSD